MLSRHNPGLQLLQRVRDEAHRFALGFHRQRREARGFESIFDRLRGVGPTRRRAILNHFGSPEAFLAATQEELEGSRAFRPRPGATSTRSCTKRGAADGHVRGRLDTDRASGYGPGLGTTSTSSAKSDAAITR